MVVKESTPVDYKRLQVSSTAFRDGELIPVKYTCDGANLSPPLQIGGIPENAACLAILVEDPDAPVATWTHWVIWNIPVTHQIKEGEATGKEGINDFQQHHYGGPCPPGGTHRYFYKVYALDRLLDLSSGADSNALQKAMSGHIIGYGELMGKYKRKK